MTWRERAACKGADWRQFFPDQLGLGGAAQLRRTRTLFCDRCPVRVECLTEALTNHETGIWGGTNDPGRRTLRRVRPGTTWGGVS